MRIVAIILLLSGFPTLIFANYFDKGVRAYEHEQYAYAVKMFKKAIKESPNDVSAYYNLGISNMEEERFGKAIWAFEKVISFNPTDQEALAKIEECALELNHEQEWKHRNSKAKSIMYSISSTIWAVICIILSVFLAIIIGFIRTHNLSLRRILFIGIFLVTGLFILSIWAGYETKSYYSISNHAVVTKLGVPIYLDKKNKSTSQLPEGTLLKRMNQDSSGVVPVQTMYGDEILVNFSDITII